MTETQKTALDNFIDDPRTSAIAADIAASLRDDMAAENYTVIYRVINDLEDEYFYKNSNPGEAVKLWHLAFDVGMSINDESVKTYAVERSKDALVNDVFAKNCLPGQIPEMWRKMLTQGLASNSPWVMRTTFCCSANCFYSNDFHEACESVGVPTLWNEMTTGVMQTNKSFMHDELMSRAQAALLSMSYSHIGNEEDRKACKQIYDRARKELSVKSAKLNGDGITQTSDNIEGTGQAPCCKPE